MFEKAGRYYADWRDTTGKRLRKSFTKQTRSTPARGGSKGHRPPSRAGDGPTIAALLVARTHGQDCGRGEYQAAKLVIAQAGSKAPRDLTNADALEIDAAIRRNGHTHSTLATRSQGVRQILRWLWTYNGAPKLDDLIRRYPGVRPRNITATDEERAAILENASPHMRLFILLCSDLAIRAGTAAILGPRHYDPASGELRFTTKKAERLTLPVTEEIAATLRQCNMSTDTPFIRQLWRAERTHGKKPYEQANSRASTLTAKFRRLKNDAGITRKLTPHDLRRTTAVALYKHTATRETCRHCLDTGACKARSGTWTTTCARSTAQTSKSSNGHSW